MSLRSMTGFASGSAAHNGYSWSFEVKSVNAKGLDIRSRVPSFLDGLDIEIKKLVSKSLQRGTVFVNLNIERDGADSDFTINSKLLDSLIETASAYSDRSGIAPASIDGLLNIKGVIDFSSKGIDEDEKKQLLTALIKHLQTVVAELIEARLGEGLRMQEILSNNMDEMLALVTSAEQSAAVRIEAVRDRFQSNVERLMQDDSSVSKDRLEQEIAMLAVKADITEEIDRLRSHITEAREIMVSPDAVGRRLDFLSQEFNREANTLCSKSNDKDLTRIGLAMKVLIDQFREQIQNIE